MISIRNTLLYTSEHFMLFVSHFMGLLTKFISINMFNSITVCKKICSNGDARECFLFTVAACMMTMNVRPKKKVFFFCNPTLTSFYSKKSLP